MILFPLLDKVTQAIFSEIFNGFLYSASTWYSTLKDVVLPWNNKGPT